MTLTNNFIKGIFGKDEQTVYYNLDHVKKIEIINPCDMGYVIFLELNEKSDYYLTISQEEYERVFLKD